MSTVVYTGPDIGAGILAEVLGDDHEILVAEPVPEDLLPKLAGSEALLDASMKVPITRHAIEAARQLQMVVLASTGATHVDAAALAERGIALLTLKGQSQVLDGLTPAAELSWALVMHCARQLRAANRHVEAGGWDRTLFPGLMLRGRTMGIIGLGRLGRWMARYATAFGMSVIYHDPLVARAGEYGSSVPLQELVARSDVISLHVHVSDETRGMIDRDLVSHFRPGTIFVNTSRGELTDEDALLEALECGRIGAMGVDVLTNEPDITRSRLWQFARTHDNLVITPHIGGFSPDALKVVVRFSAERLRDRLGER